MTLYVCVCVWPWYEPTLVKIQRDVMYFFSHLNKITAVLTSHSDKQRWWWVSHRVQCWVTITNVEWLLFILFVLLWNSRYYYCNIWNTPVIWIAALWLAALMLIKSIWYTPGFRWNKRVNAVVAATNLIVVQNRLLWQRRFHRAKNI